MPRRQSPTMYLCLSPAMLGKAFGIARRHITRAILDGHLEVRQLPHSLARRIWIADAERWYRDEWLPANPVKKKVSK